MQRPGSSGAPECRLATNPLAVGGWQEQGRKEEERGYSGGGGWPPSQPGSPLIRAGAGIRSPARETTTAGATAAWVAEASLGGHSLSHSAPRVGGSAEAWPSPPSEGLSTPSSAGYDASPPSGVPCSSPDGWQGRSARRRGKRHAIFDLQVTEQQQQQQQQEGGGPPAAAAAPGSPPASEQGRRPTPGAAAAPTRVRPLPGRRAALWPSL